MKLRILYGFVIALCVYWATMIVLALMGVE
jgi:hypothetical protein